VILGLLTHNVIEPATQLSVDRPGPTAMFSRIIRAASLQQFRAVPQRPQLPRAILLSNQRRTFLGQPSGAEADKAQEMMSRFMQSEEWKKIAAHPPAVDSIQKFMEVVKGKG
jgi:general transcription factor 3C polypeptide 5 (transcription factor C subunit 1)